MEPPPLVLPNLDSAEGKPGLDGPLAAMLDHNMSLISRVKTAMSMHRLADSLEMLAQFRDNVIMIINQMNKMPDVMGQMPPLPVR